MLSSLELSSYLFENNKRFIESLYLPWMYKRYVDYLCRHIKEQPFTTLHFKPQAQPHNLFELLEDMAALQTLHEAMSADEQLKKAHVEIDNHQPSIATITGVSLAWILSLGSAIITLMLFPTNPGSAAYYGLMLGAKLILQIALAIRNYHDNTRAPDDTLDLRHGQATKVEQLAKYYVQQDAGEASTTPVTFISSAFCTLWNEANLAGSGESKRHSETQMTPKNWLLQQVNNRQVTELHSNLESLFEFLQDNPAIASHPKMVCFITQLFEIEASFLNSESNYTLDKEATEKFSYYANAAQSLLEEWQPQSTATNEAEKRIKAVKINYTGEISDEEPQEALARASV